MKNLYLTDAVRAELRASTEAQQGHNLWLEFLDLVDDLKAALNREHESRLDGQHKAHLFAENWADACETCALLAALRGKS